MIGLYSEDAELIKKKVSMLFDTSDGVEIKGYYDLISSSPQKKELLKFVFGEFPKHFSNEKRASIRKDLHAHKLLEAFKTIIEKEKKPMFIPELISVMKNIMSFGETLEYAEELLEITKIDVGYTKEYVKKWSGSEEDHIDWNQKLQKWQDFYNQNYGPQ